MWHRFKHITEISAVALSAVFVASMVRSVCHELFNETIPYTPFYPAIVVSTMYGRMTGGLISIVLAAFAASFWLPPFGQPLIQESTDLVGLVLFILVSGVVVRLCEGMRRAQKTAESATREERLAVVREQAARVEAEEANRLRGEFLALISHELRTPLQAILGWTQLLMRSSIEEADRVQGLDTIERNARLQSRLVEDLLDVSRIAAGKLRVSPRTVNPKHVIDSAIQSVSFAAQAKQVSIDRRYQEMELGIQADPDRLQQIVWNLLSNSVKFSPPNSTITVTLRRDEDGAVIEVADQGRGIDGAFLPYVFDPFRQADGSCKRRTGGLGLGLSIVKQLVELHGGKIRATSAGLNQGTCMTITLPLVDSRMSSPFSEASTLPDKELLGIRVLVVEDDIAACESIARLLREHHCVVEAVASVDAAIEALIGFEPDVIVSDIAMPGRDGNDLLRQVRKHKSTTTRRAPALALTALSSPEDQRRAFEAGYRVYLTKPVDSSALIDAVAEMAMK